MVFRDTVYCSETAHMPGGLLAGQLLMTICKETRSENLTGCLFR